MSFLGWTTTPWTLPSNCALAVNPKLSYVRARFGDEVLIVAEALADKLMGEGEYVVEETVSGADLVGMTYTPLFDYATPEGLHPRGLRDFPPFVAGGIAPISHRSWLLAVMLTLVVRMS